MFGNIKNIGQLNDVEPEKPLSKWDIQKRLHRVNRTIGGFAKPSFNSGKVVLYVFLGVMVTFSWLWISARTKQLRLDRRGVQTMAHITGVHHSEFLWNQMDGTFVNNYLINYQFIKGTDTINAAICTLWKILRRTPLLGVCIFLTGRKPTV